MEKRLHYQGWTTRLSLLPPEAKFGQAVLAAILKASAFDPYLDISCDTGDRGNSELAANLSGLFEFIEALNANIDLMQSGEVNGTETIWICPEIPLGLVGLLGLSNTELTASIREAVDANPDLAGAEHHCFSDSEVVPRDFAVRNWTIELLHHIGKLASVSRTTESFCVDVADRIASEFSEAEARDIFAAIEDTAADHGILEAALYGSAFLRAMGLVSDAEFGLGIPEDIHDETAGISMAMAIAYIASPRDKRDTVDATAILIEAALTTAALEISQSGAESPRSDLVTRLKILPPHAIIAVAEDLMCRMDGQKISPLAMEAARRMQSLVHGDIEMATATAVSEAAERFVRSHRADGSIVAEALGQLLDDASFEASFLVSEGKKVPPASADMQAIENALTNAMRHVNPDAEPITIASRAQLMAERTR